MLCERDGSLQRVRGRILLSRLIDCLKVTGDNPNSPNSPNSPNNPDDNPNNPGNYKIKKKLKYKILRLLGKYIYIYIYTLCVYMSVSDSLLPLLALCVIALQYLYDNPNNPIYSNPSSSPGEVRITQLTQPNNPNNPSSRSSNTIPADFNGVSLQNYSPIPLYSNNPNNPNGDKRVYQKLYNSLLQLNNPNNPNHPNNPDNPDNNGGIGEYITTIESEGSENNHTDSYTSDTNIHTTGNPSNPSNPSNPESADNPDNPDSPGMSMDLVKWWILTLSSLHLDNPNSPNSPDGPDSPGMALSSGYISDSIYGYILLKTPGYSSNNNPNNPK